MPSQMFEVCPDAPSTLDVYSIPGGTCAILPAQCFVLWAALKEKAVSPLAFRVYFAAHEVKFWRVTLEPGEIYHHQPQAFQLADIQRLIPQVPLPTIARAFHQLEAMHLLTLSREGINFTSDLDDLTLGHHVRKHALNMIEQLHPRTRDKVMAIPRQLLKLLVHTGRRVVRAATLLGMLLTTMLRKRLDTSHAYKGCCKATWIANFFGVNAKRVNLERARLIAEGWFRRLPTPQRVRQRYGEWVALNLTPSGPPIHVAKATSGVAQVQPPLPRTEAKMQPLLLEPGSPSEISKNQKLPLFTPSGAYQSQLSGKPTWTDIQPNDLHLDSRREALYQEAIRRGYLNLTPADRINFHAAIAHALRVARHNACGLLRTIVEKGLWYVISQADEYNAIQRLRHAAEVTQTKQPRPVPNGLFQMTLDAGAGQAGPQPIVGSKDARVVETLTQDLKQVGVSGDLFDLIQRHGHLQDWDRSRWEHAEREVAQARLLRARERYATTGMTRRPAVVRDILDEDKAFAEAEWG